MLQKTNVDNGMVGVLIPAYNEERFIGSVVLKALQYSDEVIVVDDGSSDDTPFQTPPTSSKSTGRRPLALALTMAKSRSGLTGWLKRPYQELTTIPML